ncbi:MAG TPA: TlpA disulfide reductase family protein [Candidatus Hydrogenedentes bacterium]|nr:TlpA disulfide reductase family protein [Candidatus Hydrogenedentota bacterium]
MPRPSRSFIAGCFTGIFLTILFIVGVTLGGVYGFKSFWIQQTAGKLKPPPITTGLKADYAWKLIALDGTPYDFAQFQGKTVFLNFWNPDCLHCLAEIDTLNILYNTLQGSTVQIVGVVTEEEENLPETVQNQEIHFPVYLFKGTLPEVFQTTSRPATFIIDPSGNIVFKHLGAAKWDDPSVVSFLAMLAHAPVKNTN